MPVFQSSQNYPYFVTANFKKLKAIWGRTVAWSPFLYVLQPSMLCQACDPRWESTGWFPQQFEDSWLVVWLPFLAFPHILGCDYHPNWRTHIFQRVAKNHQGSNHQPDSHWSIGQHLNSTSWEDPLHIFDKSHPCWATQNAGKIRQQFHSRSRCWAQKCRRARAMPRIQSTFAWTFSSSDGDRTLIWLVVWNIFYFPIYWESHHPNWRTHIFQRGSNQQPVIDVGMLHGIFRWFTMVYPSRIWAMGMIDTCSRPWLVGHFMVLL